MPVQELLGGLWAYVRVEAVQEEEQLQLLSGACPSLAPLLPTAVSLLALIQMAAGHLDHRPSHSHQSSGQQGAAGGQKKDGNGAGGVVAASPGSAAGVSEASAGAGAGAGAGAWWQARAAQALASAGLQTGSLALQLTRHFSVRDLFKWCDRMQVRLRLRLGVHMHAGECRIRFPDVQPMKER